MNCLYLQIYVSMNADALLYVYRTIVVVEHKSLQTMNSREKGQGRECSWKPKKREDRLWREGGAAPPGFTENKAEDITICRI